MDELRKKYKDETKYSHECERDDGHGGFYSDEYVEWLEDYINSHRNILQLLSDAEKEYTPNPGGGYRIIDHKLNSIKTTLKLLNKK